MFRVGVKDFGATGLGLWLRRVVTDGGTCKTHKAVGEGLRIAGLEVDRVLEFI